VIEMKEEEEMVVYEVYDKRRNEGLFLFHTEESARKWIAGYVKVDKNLNPADFWVIARVVER